MPVKPVLENEGDESMISADFSGNLLHVIIDTRRSYRIDPALDFAEQDGRERRSNTAAPHRGYHVKKKSIVRYQ